MTLPQVSLIIVGAPITIIQSLKVGYGDNYNTKMRPLAVNVTEIHRQTIFLLTIRALAPLTAAPLQSSTHNHFEKITPLAADPVNMQTAGRHWLHDDQLSLGPMSALCQSDVSSNVSTPCVQEQDDPIGI